MRILINDFGGYPFPVQLSRQLASEGHYILHVYIKNIKTPHGNMEATGPNLEIVPIILKSEFKKYSALGRLKGEHEYAGKVKYIIDSFKPDIFLSANTPLFAQRVLLHKCRKSNIKFIYWCQDIHSIAIKSVFQKKMLVAGKLLGNFFKNIERKLLKQSDHIITISDDFDDILLSWGISGEKISVIHNWGPIDEIILLPKSNNWSRRLGLGSKFVILYSGTLGLKHNPMLIAEAAKKIVKDERILFLVISEGIGAEILQRQIHDMRLTNLMVLPYQDYKDLSMVLGSADILLSILEEDAALFSVPSKVLTYLCAKKPIVLSVTETNLSAKIVSGSNAGFCAAPNDVNSLVDKINILVSDEELRKSMGENGRAYAARNFNIIHITEKFIDIFRKVTEK